MRNVEVSRPERMKPSNWGEEGVGLIRGSRLKAGGFCSGCSEVEVIPEALMFRRVSELLSGGGNYGMVLRT